jgi:hypothetical protein
MQQRRPRLGDVLDDYCPRERRVTNHAVVAMIDDDVKQTRCTTCDTEHEYKQAKAPTLRRKKDAVATAYKEVLSAVAGDTNGTLHASVAPVTPVPGAEPAARAAASAAADAVASPTRDAEPRSLFDDVEASEADGPNGDANAIEESARVHRRLIRATLPRQESQQVVRPIPEFTMRQPTGRPGKFRGGSGRGPAGRAMSGRGPTNGNGNTRSGFGGGRPAGNRGGMGDQGRPAGRNDMNRPGRGGQPRHGKKHSR